MSPRSRAKRRRALLAKGAKAPEALTPSYAKLSPQDAAINELGLRLITLEQLVQPSTPRLVSNSINDAPRTAAPRDISAQSRLSAIAARLDGINGHLGDMMPRLFNEGDSASLAGGVPPANGAVHSMIDLIEGLVNSISGRVEYLSARL